MISPLSDFLVACRQGDLATARRLLPRLRNPFGPVERIDESPVHLAARRHPVLLAFLLDKGGDPHLELPNWGTPLQEAAREGTAACVRLLLERGADPNARRDDAITALYQAAVSHDPDRIAGLLLAAGADPDARIFQGPSPLSAAVSLALEEADRPRGQGRPETWLAAARRLAAAGAALDAPLYDGRPALEGLKELCSATELLDFLSAAGQDQDAEHGGTLTSSPT